MKATFRPHQGVPNRAPNMVAPESRQIKRRRAKHVDAPARYLKIDKFGNYRLVRCCVHGSLYIQWFDSAKRQTYRLTLGTDDLIAAAAEVKRIADSGATGNPRLLISAPITVAQILERYRTQNAERPSAEFNRIAIDKHLVPIVGEISVTDWRKDNFRMLETSFKEKGLSLGYLSRVCAVLRAALKDAENDEVIVRAPKIPEIMTEDDRDNAPLKGRVMSIEEVARLVDEASDPHFLEFLVAAINTGARPITILECEIAQVEWSERPLFDLNPAGRKQNKKYRPAIIVPATWAPWLKNAQDPLIKCDGQPVKSVKTAMRGARKRAGLEPDTNGVPVTAYSIRHTLGRFLEAQNVPVIQREILLGHQKTYAKRMTERYSPTNRHNPKYLDQATEAIEAFVNEINGYTKKWDLLRPHTLKAEYVDV